MKPLLNTLFVQTQGTYLHLDHDTLKLEIERVTRFQVPLHHLGSIVVFGNILISPFLIQRCGEDGRSIVWLTEHGRFKGQLVGPTTGNVLLRRAQHQALAQPLPVAQAFIAGKLQNARNILMRGARETDDPQDREALLAAAGVHGESIRSVALAGDLDQLRGIEGFAARSYFGCFTQLIRTNRADFAFTERTRRPPRDPINSLLSFVYTLLTSECVAACEGVGLDPQMGFLHVLRPGRPALALDLMEELRAPLADRLVLTLINRGQLQPKDFIERPGGAWSLTDDARKALLVAYQKRKQEEVLHPVLGDKVPFGLVAHLQARLLARYLRGDVPSYQPFIYRG